MNCYYVHIEYFFVVANQYLYKTLNRINYETIIIDFIADI